MQRCQEMKKTDRHLIGYFLEVNAPHQIHFAAVDLQDVKSGALIGVGEFNLAVNPAWSQQCSIQDVYPVGGHQDLQQQKQTYQERSRRCKLQCSRMSILLVAFKACCSTNKHAKSVKVGASCSAVGCLSCWLVLKTCSSTNRNTRNIQDGASCTVTSRMSMFLFAIKTCISRNMHLKNATGDANCS